MERKCAACARAPGQHLQKCLAPTISTFVIQNEYESGQSKPVQMPRTWSPGVTHKKVNNQRNTFNLVQRLAHAPQVASMTTNLSRVCAPTHAAPALTWLGPCAPWHTYRTTRRIHQPRHVPSLPNEAAWTARLHEYLDRDDEIGCSAHIPPRVYNTVVDTALMPSRTQFTRYGWVRTFGEYDAYASENQIGRAHV